MSQDSYGFVGLGNMGGPMAANIAAAGHDLVVYDIAGSAARIPNGARIASSIEDLATNARSVFLSLPDGSASLDVAHKLSGAREKRTATVIELSTIGISAARQLHRLLADATIEYIDTPVSGGTAGAHAGTVTLM